MSDLVADPVWRTLRIFAFDPAISGQFDSSGIAEIKIDHIRQIGLFGRPEKFAELCDTLAKFFNR